MFSNNNSCLYPVNGILRDDGKKPSFYRSGFLHFSDSVCYMCTFMEISMELLEAVNQRAKYVLKGGFFGQISLQVCTTGAQDEQ